MEQITPNLVREDGDLSRLEKETVIRFDKTQDEAFVFSAERGIMRRLLQHPLFTVTGIDQKGEHIVGVQGRFPIAAISIKSSKRSQAGHAGMVTNGVTQVEENATIDL